MSSVQKALMHIALRLPFRLVAQLELKQNAHQKRFPTDETWKDKPSSVSFVCLFPLMQPQQEGQSNESRSEVETISTSWASTSCSPFIPLVWTSHCVSTETLCYSFCLMFHPFKKKSVCLVSRQRSGHPWCAHPLPPLPANPYTCLCCPTAVFFFKYHDKDRKRQPKW